MLTTFQWACLLSILAATLAGGYYPLFHQRKSPGELTFPRGEAFTVGVFMALALTLMLPSALHLLGKAFPDLDFPLASLIAVTAYLSLLALEHAINRMRDARPVAGEELSPPVIPVIMTVMIAVPSFFLGTAFGVSAGEAALFIFIAIMLHKSSAAFALALKMVRSSMTRGQVWMTFSLFTFATPLGIVTGEEIHNWVGAETMRCIKGTILGMAAGTFLYMATLHDLKHAPMITKCNSRVGFSFMLAGFILTAIVRYLIGEAHKLG